MGKKSGCDPHDIALKTFFLGPQAENHVWLRDTSSAIFDAWCNWRRSVHPEDGAAISPQDQQEPLFLEQQRKVTDLIGLLMNRFEGEVPKFSPRYNSHMFSEISLPALFGHIIALLHNPNNISGETSRVGIKIEDEAIGDIARMLGFDPQQARGHFTSGGTMANFEALFRARLRLTQWLTLGAYLRERHHGHLNLIESAHMGWSKYHELSQQVDRHDFSNWVKELNPPSPHYHRRISTIFGVDYQGPVVLIPSHKHYSWIKGSELTGLSNKQMIPLTLNAHSQLDTASWRETLDRKLAAQIPVLLTVSICGSTELGAVDPIFELATSLRHLERDRGLYLWHHADAAYGGYFATLCKVPGTPLSQAMIQDLIALKDVTSLTLDPHKLGYVPYASGLFLAGSRRDYALYHVDAPYVQFDEREDKGPQTLEGSRSAAGAVATWLTSKSIGLNEDGYGRILNLTILARKKLEDELKKVLPDVRIVDAGQTNILAFTVAREGQSTADANAMVERIYEHLSARHEAPFYASKTTLSWKNYGTLLDHFLTQWNGKRNSDQLELVRLCLLNPFFSNKESKTNYTRELAMEIARITSNPSMRHS